MSFKRNFMDQDDNNDDSQVFQKRSRFGDEGGFRGRGRGGGRGGDRGRGGFRGRGGGGGGRGNFRGRGGFNRSDDDQDNGGRMSFRGRGRGGGRGFGDRNFGDRNFGDRSFGDRGFGGRGRGGDRGRGGGRGRFGDRGFGDRRGGNFRGRGRGGGGDRPNFNQRECNIKVGQDAPTFENITDDKSNPVSLDQFKGQYVVLFIYFKDGTYGCSIEQKNFNDIKEKFDKYNAVILGVSRDDEATHKATIEQQKLTYSLLSDSESKICQAYEAIDERDRITRSTFLISPQGKIVGVWPKVFSFETHAEEVLTKLEEVINGKSNTKDGENEDNDKNEDDDENDNGENEEDDDQEKDEEDDDEQQDDDDDDE